MLFLHKICKAFNVCYAQSICFTKNMQFNLTATSQRTSVFSWMIITQTVPLCFAAYRPGCIEGWKTLTAANWRNMLNLTQLSPGAHADDVILCGETVFQSCGGTEGAVAVEQAI